MINNYINIVVLGNFNPSILTHKFLVSECGFDFGKEPTKQAPQMPVVASIEYDRILFFADLGRFEIKETSCTNPKESKLPSYLDGYLKKLPHTPIMKCGANFSYEAEIAKERIKSVEEKLGSNRESIRNMLEVDKFKLQVFFDVGVSEERIERWIISTESPDRNVSTHLNVSRKINANKITVDFNYEVNLQNNVRLIEHIIANYNNVYDLFLTQIQHLFGKEIL